MTHKGDATKEKWYQCGTAKEEAPGEFLVEFVSPPTEGRFQIRCKDATGSKPYRDTIVLKDVLMGRHDGEGKPVYSRVGIGFVNRDGSINVVLEAFPYNNRVLIRPRRALAEIIARAEKREKGAA